MIFNLPKDGQGVSTDTSNFSCLLIPGLDAGLVLERDNFRTCAENHFFLKIFLNSHLNKL